MSPSGLRLDRLLRRPPVAELLAVLDPETRTTIVGSDGRVLRGGEPDGPSYPLRVGDDVVGAVAGADAAALAAVLERLGAVELERRALADEALDLYREVNLLYALVERFAGLDERGGLAERALAEVTRLVPADSAFVVIVDVSGSEVSAAIGAPWARPVPDLEPARTERRDAGALLVAPMAVGDLQLGAVVLTRDTDTFTAAELKLGCAVASQAAAFVERVLDAERRRAEAEEREARLRRQIDELRIELDDRRQAEHVRRITDTDYFANLRQEATRLRDLVDGRIDDPEEPSPQTR